MADDDWITAAMADQTLVAQLLLKLKQPPPPPPRLSDVYAPALRLDWSVKQRRSKQAVARKKAYVTRASPTTPLSWSGGTSDSCCAADESKPIDTARSKVVAVSDTPITKRSRKKKTLNELKEEESLLLKERQDLKNQLATMRLAVEKLRGENERLKRLKVDSSSRQTPELISTSEKKEAGHLSSFVLPDLNLPIDGISDVSVLCGVS